jgi:hypothetical protein
VSYAFPLVGHGSFLLDLDNCRCTWKQDTCSEPYISQRGGGRQLSRSPPNAWENVRSKILAGRISGSDGLLCKLEAKARMVGLECVKDPSMIDSATAESPVSPSWFPIVVCPKGVEPDVQYALGLLNKR